MVLGTSNSSSFLATVHEQLIQWKARVHVNLLRSSQSCHSISDALLATLTATGWSPCAHGLYPHITFLCSSWLQVWGGCENVPPRSLFRNEESLSQLLEAQLAGNPQSQTTLEIALAAESRCTQGVSPVSNNLSAYASRTRLSYPKSGQLWKAIWVPQTLMYVAGCSYC